MYRTVKPAAVVTLFALFSLNGVGVLFAYSESVLPKDERCSRSCCDLGKMGAAFASSCCQLRCQEDVPQSRSEPAREQICLKQIATQSAVLTSFSDLLLSADLTGPTVDSLPLQPAEIRVPLHLKHSVILV